MRGVLLGDEDKSQLRIFIFDLSSEYFLDKSTNDLVYKMSVNYPSTSPNPKKFTILSHTKKKKNKCTKY